MNIYSTNNRNLKVTLEEAVLRGLAPDQGLFMPGIIRPLPVRFFDTLPDKTFQQIAFEVASHLLGSELPEDELERIATFTTSIEAPVVAVGNDTFALELFHGPTLAFKDFGARFMSQVLGYFSRRQERDVIVLVATSGDTGSAVANGFLGVQGTRVVVLYPKGRVSELQEKQFATLGENITAVEVAGSFDDCQRLVKQAFSDRELRESRFLTSANSINLARLIPQSFYYFHAYSQVKKLAGKEVVFSVPSGNFGNLTGGLLAKRMGLPVKQFIAATNINDVVPAYLRSRKFEPRLSVQTISNAMDVGNPSNFARILDLYNESYEAITRDVRGYSFTDEETRKAMEDTFRAHGYVLDPHGAVAYLGLKKYFEEHGSGVAGVFLETAHPAKFREEVEATLKVKIEIPPGLQKFMGSPKRSIGMDASFEDLKKLLMSL